MRGLMARAKDDISSQGAKYRPFLMCKTCLAYLRIRTRCPLYAEVLSHMAIRSAWHQICSTTAKQLDVVEADRNKWSVK